MSGMRTRIGVTRRITDDTWVSVSGRPSIPKPKLGWMVFWFFAGATIFLAFGLMFVAAFAP